jgi:hypothetical protein
MRAAPAAGPVAGAIGAAAQTFIERHQKGNAAQTPAFKGSAYVAVTEGEIALIQLKSGLVSRKLDRVLVPRARAEIASAQLAEAKAVGPLTIAFTDNSAWEFDVPRPAPPSAVLLTPPAGTTTGTTGSPTGPRGRATWTA